MQTDSVNEFDINKYRNRDISYLNSDSFNRYKTRKSQVVNRRNYDSEYDDDFKDKRKFSKSKDVRFNFIENLSNNEDLEENKKYQFTTNKYIRRKPRDRYTNTKKYQKEQITTSIYVDNEEFYKPNKIKENPEFVQNTNTPYKRKRYPKEYEDDSDYDDMRRILRIKNKLPTLLRKSKGIFL